jgi:PKD repeat protein
MSLVGEKGAQRSRKTIKILPVAILISILILGVFLPTSTIIKPIHGQQYSWRDDFNYNTLDKMRNAGWELFTTDHGGPVENFISVTGDAIILDNDGSTAAHARYRNIPSGIYDWKVEVRGMWIGRSYGSLGVSVKTERHYYEFSGDGYYPRYKFLRDGNEVHFEGYAPQLNVWMTFAIERIGNTIKVYHNGELKNTFSEPDPSSDGLTWVRIASGWLSTDKYDYILILQLSQYYLRVGFSEAVVNDRRLDSGNPEVSVNPGGSIRGYLEVNVENVQPGSWITPVIGAESWRRNQHTCIVSWAPTGTSKQRYNFDLTAPSTPGVYYIGVFAGWWYSCDELASNDHPPNFGDGDDVWDMRDSDWEAVISSGRAPEGAVYRELGRGIRIRVAATIPTSTPPSLTLFSPEVHELTVTINGVTTPGTPGTTITRIHWDWGDGRSEDHWFPASHTYSQAGTYTITVTSHQSDGLSTTKSLTVSVGGGRLSGYIYGFTKDNTLIPLDGASIKALKNGEIVKVVYSRNGFYEMYLPVGTYTLIAEHPGYRQANAIVTIESPGDLVEWHITLELVFDLLLNIESDRSSYRRGDEVMLTAHVAYRGGALTGVDVAFEVRNPRGGVIAGGSATTDNNGVARKTFTLPGDAELGKYSAYASISYQGLTASNRTEFSVIEGGFHVSLTLHSTDPEGNPKSSFRRGESPSVKLVVKNDGGSDITKAHILITFYDSNNVPVSFAIDIVDLGIGEERTSIRGFTLSSSAAIGTYKAEVIVLTDFIANGGVYIPDGNGSIDFQVTT